MKTQVLSSCRMRGAVNLSRSSVGGRPGVRQSMDRYIPGNKNHLHPIKITLHPKIEVWKMIFVFNCVIVTFHVEFSGVYGPWESSQAIPFGFPDIVNTTTQTTAGQSMAHQLVRIWKIIQPLHALLQWMGHKFNSINVISTGHPGFVHQHQPRHQQRTTGRDKFKE